MVVLIFSSQGTAGFVKVSNTQYGLDPSINTNYYTHTTNEDTITVDSNGYYIISSNVNFLVSGRSSKRSSMQSTIYINGSAQAASKSDTYARGSSYNDEVNTYVTAYYYLSANDTIKVRVNSHYMESTGVGNGCNTGCSN